MRSEAYITTEKSGLPSADQYFMSKRTTGFMPVVLAFAICAELFVGICLTDKTGNCNIQAALFYSAASLFDIVLNGSKGLVTNHMLDLAGILCRGFFVHT